MPLSEEEYESKVKANVQAVIDALSKSLPNVTITEKETSINHGYIERKLYVNFRDGTEFIIVKVS